MDASCYSCERPIKRYSPLRGQRCGKCEYRARKKQIIAKMTEWRINNRERMRANESARYAARKVETIKAYGGKCAKCGEYDSRFLTVDHVHNNGAADRAARKNKTSDVHIWLKRHGYPKGFQILCGNCNLKKEIERRRSASGPHWLRSQAAKTRVIAQYGSKCTCCRENDIDKLVIDHVKGGGSQEKRSYPSRNVYFFLDGKSVNKEKYQILCQNCNQAKASYGQCPGHRKLSRKHVHRSESCQF